MLTIEDFKQIEGLSDEQKAKLLTLSNNDTQKDVNEALGKSHGLLDDTFKAIYNIDKPSGAKSYEFWPEHAKAEKEKADKNTAKTDLDALKIEYAKLEQQLKDGKMSDAQKELMAKMETTIKDNESTIAKLREDVKTTASDWEKKYNDSQTENFDDFATNYLSSALANRKFKDNIPQTSIDATLSVQMKAVMATGKPEKRKNDDGSHDIVFRDENGLLITDKEDLQKPVTGRGLYLKSLSEILDGGHKQTGAGTKGGGGGGGGQTLDMSGITNRVDGDKMLTKHMAAKGYAVESDEYQTEYAKLRTENGIDKLPLNAPAT